MFTEHIGKYARLELERRFLVETPPVGLTNGWLITDRYLSGTRLRLRRMDKSDGSKTIYKLGQKFRGPDQGPTQATMTTMYLNVEEYERLSSLDSAEIEKVRFDFDVDGLHFSLDIFQHELEGLVLAEIEKPDAGSLALVEPPDSTWIDVTEEHFFSGAALAQLSRGAFLSGLQRWKESYRRTTPPN